MLIILIIGLMAGPAVSFKEWSTIESTNSIVAKFSQRYSG